MGVRLRIWRMWCTRFGSVFPVRGRAWLAVGLLGGALKMHWGVTFYSIVLFVDFSVEDKIYE